MKRYKLTFTTSSNTISTFYGDLDAIIAWSFLMEADPSIIEIKVEDTVYYSNGNWVRHFDELIVTSH